MRKLVAVPSATSPESRCALPDAWVRRIFERMEDRYGDLWAQRFGGVPKDRLMRTWAEDLSDLSGEEIAYGLRACRDHKFVPSLPDFRALCRPPIDFDGALLEAIEQMARRESGRTASASATSSSTAGDVMLNSTSFTTAVRSSACRPAGASNPY